MYMWLEKSISLNLIHDIEFNFVGVITNKKVMI